MRCFLSSLLFVSLALSAGCSQPATAESDALLFGFELAAFDGIAATDIAVQIEPRVPENDLVQPASQLMADALRACGELARTAGAMDTPQGLELSLRGATLARVQASQQKPSPLAECLVTAIDGKTFKSFDAAEHKVTIQVRRHFELP